MTALEKGPCSNGPDISVSSVLGGNYRFDRHVIKDEKERDWVRNEVFNTYRNSFGRNPFTTVHRIEKRIEEGAIVRFASIPSNGRKVGFAAYYMRSVMVDGRELLVAEMATKAILRDHQNHRIGTRFARDMIEEEMPDVVTGTTANPFAYLAYLDTGYIDLGDYKEDDEYPGRFQRGIHSLLTSIDREKIAQGISSNRAAEVTDLRYGLCVGYFNPEESEKLIIDKERSPRAYQLMEDWKKIGLDPERGDAKRYWLPVCRTNIQGTTVSNEFGRAA